MYLAVRRYQAAPGSVGEVARLVREGFVPIVGAIPGLVGYYVADIGDGEVVAVNIFRDREGAEESNRLAGEWANEHLAGLLTSPHQFVAREVLAETHPTAAPGG